MNKYRLEAFSDGVIAIIITIMVLEIKAPESTELKSLAPLLPVIVSHILSFIYLGIYWNNHHHMLHTVKYVKGGTLWANLHLLFWLSLIPFSTAWVGQNKFASLPLALYGFILLMASIAYYILQSRILKTHGENSLLSKAIGRDIKGKISPFLYTFGMISAFFIPWLAGIIYVGIAFIWLIPDKRIERTLEHEKEI